MFTIYDDIHCDYTGNFETKEAGLAELDRLSKLPWDQEPNTAPCKGWKECGRKWKLIEYDGVIEPLNKERLIAVITVESPKRQDKLRRNVRAPMT